MPDLVVKEQGIKQDYVGIDCGWIFFVIMAGMPLCFAAWEGLRYCWKELSCIL